MRATTGRGAQGQRGRARDPEVTSRILSAVRGSDTRPELALRRALHAQGLRYRLHVKSLAGRPDIAFPRRRVVVFVDGDYWHGRGWRERGYKSLEHQFAHWHRGDWWLAKIRTNVARDRRQTRSLRRDGWIVIRLSDSSIKTSLDRCVERVIAALSRSH
jgi:DNA mismatch endonuclease, patch repair protein